MPPNARCEIPNLRHLVEISILDRLSGRSYGLEFREVGVRMTIWPPKPPLNYIFLLKPGICCGKGGNLAK